MKCYDSERYWGYLFVSMMQMKGFNSIKYIYKIGMEFGNVESSEG